MTGYSWKQAQEQVQMQEKDQRRRNLLLGSAISVLVLTLLVAGILIVGSLAFPMTAGGQGRAKLIIGAYPLGSDIYRIMELPRERKALGVGKNEGEVVLYVQHPIGAAVEEVSIWLLYAGATWDDLGGDLFYIGLVEVQGIDRFCYILQMEQWPPEPEALSLPGLPVNPGPRGPEPRFLEKP